MNRECRYSEIVITACPLSVRLSGGPVGQNQLVWHDEIFSGEIG